MRIRARFLAAGAGGVALALGVGVAAAQDGRPQTSPQAPQTSSQAPQTSPQSRQTQEQAIPSVHATGTVASFERAARAALDAANGGALESIDRENGGYEVKVRKAGGAEHELFIDRDFRAVANERDDDRDDRFERDDDRDDPFERDDDRDDPFDDDDDD